MGKEQVWMLENQDFRLELSILEYFIRQLNGVSSSHLVTQVKCLREWLGFDIYILGNLAYWQNLRPCDYLCGHPENEQQ